MVIEYEVGQLELLIRNEAFKIYLKMLQEHFDDNYKKLRKCKKAESTYDRINGLLDGLEYAMKVSEIEIKDFRQELLNKEKGE